MNERSATNASDSPAPERSFLVGRQHELGQFRKLVAGELPGKRIVSVYGIGGMGKSFLLDAFRRAAVAAGRRFVLLDSRDFLHTPASLCARALDLLEGRESAALGEIDETPPISIAEGLERINSIAAAQPVCIAFDTYEELGSLDPWIREHWIPRLHPSVVFAFGGRYALQGEWKLSPFWRQRIVWLPLSELSYADVREYMRNHDLGDEEWIRHVWNKTKGHPLSVSLAAHLGAVESSASLQDGDVLPLVASRWLKEVPGPELRELVEVAAVLRHFHQDMLSFVLDRTVSTESFERLVSLSFVRRVQRGWLLHDLVRAAVSEELRVRSPERFTALWKRCVSYFYRSIVQSSGTRRDVSWEAGEAFYYLSDHLIREFFYQTASPHVFEPIDDAGFAEAEAYLARRKKESKEARIPYVDPLTRQPKEFVITPEQSLFPVKHVHLDELRALPGAQIRLLRKPSGETVGLSVVIPINARTLGFLSSKPLSSAFFRSLDERRLEEIRAAVDSDYGWFVYAIDVNDFGDWTLRADAGLHFITLMLTGGFIAGSPPPLPFFDEVHDRLGCEASEAVHYDYDGRTPARTYYLDTRGARMHGYLRRMIGQLGLAAELPPESGAFADEASAAGGGDDASSERMPNARVPEEGTDARPVERGARARPVERGTDAPSVERGTDAPSVERATDARERSSDARPLELAAGLTNREAEIVELIAQGLTNAEVAQRLFVSEITVKKHLTSIFLKTGVKNRTQLVREWVSRR